MMGYSRASQATPPPFAEDFDTLSVSRSGNGSKKLPRGNLVMPAKPRGHRSQNRQRKKRRLFNHKQKMPLVDRAQRTIRFCDRSATAGNMINEYNFPKKTINIYGLDQVTGNININLTRFNNKDPTP